MLEYIYEVYVPAETCNTYNYGLKHLCIDYMLLELTPESIREDSVLLFYIPHWKLMSPLGSHVCILVCIIMYIRRYGSYITDELFNFPQNFFDEQWYWLFIFLLLTALISCHATYVYSCMLCTSEYFKCAYVCIYIYQYNKYDNTYILISSIKSSSK